jgi:hypothetical protein
MRREKKAQQAKKIVMAASSATRRDEVTFSENSRLEFIQGFRKRKAERRKHGLTMELLKQAKAKRDNRKERRVAVTDKHVDLDIGARDKNNRRKDFGDDDEAEAMPAAATVTRVEFTDTHTQGMFDGQVVVEVDEGIDEDMDLLKNYDGGEGEGRKVETDPSKIKRGPTRYAKAQRIVKETMGSKKRKTKPNAHSVKAGAGKRDRFSDTQATSALLRKAGVKGKSADYKGKTHKSKAMRGGGGKKGKR